MKLLLIFTSLFALGDMEQPLHVYTSEEIRLDELAKLDELGNTGNDKKEVVDPRKENTGYDKKKAVDPKEENTGYDKKKAVDPKEENTDKKEAIDPKEENTGDDKKKVIDFKEENTGTGHEILIIEDPAYANGMKRNLGNFSTLKFGVSGEVWREYEILKIKKFNYDGKGM